MAYNFNRGLAGAGSGAAAGSAFGPWGSAIGGAMGAFGGFGNDPSQDAAKYYNRIPGTIKPYYDPYINAGRGALSDLQKQYGQMMQNPGDIISRLGAGYQKSPGYDWRMKQGQGAINNANAAGGMAGTMQHGQQAGELAGNLASEDYEKYLNHALGLYGGGLEGMGGLNKMGYEASGSLADSLSSVLMNQGNLAYSGGINNDQRMGGAMGNFYGAMSRRGNMPSQPANSNSNNNWWWS